MVVAMAQRDEVAQQNGRPRLLIVDDEPINRHLLSRLFTADYDVVSVGSGHEALDALAAGHFDVVLLDIMMPGLSGFDVLEIIRGTPEYADLPVILVSALADSEDIIQGLHLGANDYITKPVNLDVAHARVRTQLTLKRLLDEHKRVIAQLEAIQTMRERFFRIASHDLRGPLGNLRVGQALLREMVGEQPGVAPILDTIEMTVNAMEEVIEDFLEMSALHGETLDLHLDCVGVSGIIWDVVTQYSMTASKKHITLQVEQAEGAVLADAKRLSQALGNLVSNAIKYSPPESVVRLWAQQRAQRVRISVADQGPGIPAEERGLLFTQFGKLSTRPTGGEGSTGLGLWIVKQLIVLQNGEVGVDCPPEGGSIFWIELPTCDSPRMTSPAVNSAAAS